MRYLLSFLFVAVFASAEAQSLELLQGTEASFADVQFLTQFEKANRVSTFFRTRAEIQLDDGSANYFSGLFLNYTTSWHVGPTVIGSISNGGNDNFFGVHFFKGSVKGSIFSQVFTDFKLKGSYRWFTIARWYPEIKSIPFYASAELFTMWRESGHRFSFIGLRAGITLKGAQVGIGYNVSSIGNEFTQGKELPGVFVRKAF
ncbi:hypothetical protein [Sanyastnella coralliicola]|uniref:hypothetical protein n=1 Tax=Sanyastnella coralliicola TaxID=3069118 RepID=UPI0027B8F5CE|nr:hypothetical protein [Longitalea sp. SCSIO 12813]